MREMILNHASLSACAESDRHLISGWLQDISKGMGRLASKNIVVSSLSSCRHCSQIFWHDGYSLLNSLQDLVKKEKGNGGAGYIMDLMSRMPSPKLNEMDALELESFELYDEASLSKEDSYPLFLSAVLNTISIGFPTSALWDKDEICIKLIKLLDDGGIREVSKDIDHLARSEHVEPIYERHQGSLIKSTNRQNFWERREKLFPSLMFGVNVKEDIKNSAISFPAILYRLGTLNESSEEWPILGGAEPPWKTKVTRESDSTLNNPKLLKERIFPSQSNEMELFDWHARYGNSIRIHLRLIIESRRIEIGYIGPHLPTARD